MENVRHRPRDAKRGRFFSTADVGKRKALAEFEALAPVTIVEAFDTAGWRHQFGLAKTPSPSHPPVFEVQTVDAVAMLLGVTGCRLGMPAFHIFTAVRFVRRQLHKQQPQKGGIRRRYGGTSNGTFFRKGDWVEVVTKFYRIRGWVCGLPTAATPKVGVAGTGGPLFPRPPTTFRFEPDAATDRVAPPHRFAFMIGGALYRPPGCPTPWMRW